MTTQLRILSGLAKESLAKYDALGVTTEWREAAEVLGGMAYLLRTIVQEIEEQNGREQSIQPTAG